jgi:hypothetical protein
MRVGVYASLAGRRRVKLYLINRDTSEHSTGEAAFFDTKGELYGKAGPYNLGSHESQGVQPPRFFVFLRRRGRRRRS